MSSTVGVPPSKLAKDVAPKINALLDEFESEDDTLKIQAFGYTMRNFLLKEDAAYPDRIKSRFCGVDPENRDKEMLIPIAVWELLCIVATKKGWDPSKLVGALCAELPTDPTAKAYALERNIKLHNKAKHLLAPLDVESVRVLTSASSHMTAVLRLVNHAANAKIKPPELDPDFDIKMLLDEHGFLSKTRVLACCPGMAEYCEDGILYTVVRNQVAALCPRLMAALSKADNAAHDVFRKETWLQCLLSMHSKAIAIDATTDEDWEEICKSIVKG